MAIRWAPWKVPIERRLQTAAVTFWALTLPICIAICLLFLFVPVLWPLTIAYLIFMVMDNAPRNGGRAISFIRKHRAWRYYSDYFPLQLKKEIDLDPSKSYLFGYHPHGIIGLGAWGNFACDSSTHFSKLFPGINLRVCTLDNNFKIPLFRDLIMGIGMISASKESISSVLKKGSGNSVMIVVGGAAEALDARPGTSDLTIKNRKGFVKMALRHGASLVPVFSFGENNAYNVLIENPRGSRIRRIQNYLKKLFGFSMPIFIGRGIFNYNVGLLPIRSPIVSVVGKPIDLPKMEDVDEDTLNKYHDLYINELRALYDRHKDVYDKQRKADLRIL